MPDDVKSRYKLTDPAVQDLGSFLTAVPLSNGTVANLPGGQNGLTNHLAQAILNWQDNIVYDQGEWVTRFDIEATPDFGDIEIRSIGDDEAFRLMHRGTGIVALEETREAALRSLKHKVRAHEREARDGDNGDGN